MRNDNHSSCPLCGGKKLKGKTTFTVDLGFGIVVIREVPAMVCSQCGTEWMNDDSAKKVERIVNNARKNHNLIEVVSLAKSA